MERTHGPTDNTHGRASGLYTSAGHPSIHGKVSANKLQDKIQTLIFENHRTLMYYCFISNESYS